LNNPEGVVAQQDYALHLLQALAEQAPAKLLSTSKHIAHEGGNFSFVLQELLNHLHQISIFQALSDRNALSKELLALAPHFTPEDTQLFYQIGIKGLEELHLAPTVAIGFEMILLRMYAFKPAQTQDAPLLAHQMPTTPEVALQSDHLISAHQQPVVVEPPAIIIANSTGGPNQDSPSWAEILTKLNLNGLALSALEHTEFFSKQGKELTLRVNTGHQSVFTKAVVTRIEAALSHYYQEEIKLILLHDTQVSSTPAQQKKIIQQKQQQAAEEALQQDPFFQQLKQEFDAELIKNSIVAEQDDL